MLFGRQRHSPNMRKSERVRQWQNQNAPVCYAHERNQAANGDATVTSDLTPHERAHERAKREAIRRRAARLGELAIAEYHAIKAEHPKYNIVGGYSTGHERK
jgi:hypothetical protein